MFAQLTKLGIRLQQNEAGASDSAPPLTQQYDR